MSEVEATEGRLLAGRYRLGVVLGKGGMGTVWRAVDETLGRSVAVKELRFGSVDEDEKRRMITRTLREAKATARIRNTGAITVFDVVEEDQRPWIVMELVEGRSLADAIREDGPLAPARAAEIGLVVLDVLRAAHTEGILHRDVKPSNVLIAREGRVVLGDFGIAQIDGDPSVTSTGMLVGAPSYISPERARGHKPGPPADLWSLGALLYAAVEGHPPYDKGSAIATLTAVMTEPIGPMPHAGPLAGAIRGLLVKDPEQRLDEPGARAMLTAVVRASERAAAAPAPAEGARTAVLPVDPQPKAAGTPRLPGARQAPRVPARTAVGAAGRGTAATPPGGRGPGGPGGRRGPAARSGGPAAAPAPRRTVLVVIAVLVVALLGTLIGIALANSGNGKGGNGTGGAGTVTTAPAATHTHGGKKGKGGNGNGTEDGNANANGGGSGSNDQAGDDASADTGGTALPAGWFVYSDAEGFSIALPAGWKRTGDNGSGSGSTFSGGDGRKLLVDWTHTPGPSALADWRNKSQHNTIRGYRQIRVEKATYRGYDAADWEFFTRTQDGRQMRVLDRGFVVDATHGYAIMMTVPVGDWDTPANRKARATFFASFKPA